ncbi:MAG: ubiquinone/menaquinone biosynthesis methyltransferase [Rhizobiales bacterium]|nr:ubiquinone/menaquinone biosynthesis methyltransferase [Hyphomicrobiales bacterium]
MKDDTALDRLQSLAPLGETFGATRVEAQARRTFVRELFDQVAPRYDLMNDLMSFGLHRLWKQAAVAAAAATPGAATGTIVDLAGGTGDLSLALRKRLPQARIVLADASPGMVAVAEARAQGKIECKVAEGEHMPFETASVDAVMLSFGLRNMTDPPAAIREVFRVLKPGGRLVLLEFSKPAAWFAPLYNIFSRFVIPALGALVSGNRGAYRYLVDSIRLFPDAQSITRELTAAGFDRVTLRRFVFGVAALHVAEIAE